MTYDRTGEEQASAVRFALIGCGDIGAINAAAIEAAAGAELAGCFDIVDSLAEGIASHHGVVKYPSPAALLSRPDIDAVIVATPHDSHEHLALSTLRAEKHLLLEKPLAADLCAARRIARAAGATGVVADVLFTLRHDRGYLHARDALNGGMLGEPRALLSSYLVDKARSYYFGGYSNRSISTWRLSKARAGGGVLIMNLLHHLDAARGLFANECDWVFADTAQSEVSAEIEDIVSVIARFGPAIATFVGGASVIGGPGESLSIWGSSGRAMILPHPEVVTSDDGPLAGLPTRSWDPRVRAIESFAAVVSGRAVPETDLTDALAVQEIVAAAYESAAIGRPVAPATALG